MELYKIILRSTRDTCNRHLGNSVLYPNCSYPIVQWMGCLHGYLYETSESYFLLEINGLYIRRSTSLYIPAFRNHF
jgi:hypothetical protein